MVGWSDGATGRLKVDETAEARRIGCVIDWYMRRDLSEETGDDNE